MNNKWGTYPCFVERGIELICPDDFESFKKEANNCKVFECINESDYLTLRYNNNCYRVKDKLFKPVPAPKFTFGQVVKTKDKNEEVSITDIMWHSSNSENYYLVSIGNKKKSKRYFESDLM
jgi:hypothetical protein